MKAESIKPCEYQQYLDKFNEFYNKPYLNDNVMSQNTKIKKTSHTITIP
jgi:hypothetical protein